MDLRVVLLCVVTAYGQSPDYERHYKSEIRPTGPIGDLRGENTNTNPGFVQPLDFTSFTQQFFAGGHNILSAPFSFGTPEVFGAESKKTGVFQTANSDFVPFSGSPFPEDVKTNNTGFVQPVRFVSPFDRDGSGTKIYNHQKSPPPSIRNPGKPRESMYKAATETEEDEEESPYYKQQSPSPSRQNYKHAPKLTNLKRDPPYGKSSYPSYKSERNPSAEAYYPSNYPKPKDVEVFLPKDKLITLPMVNGKPKPYDGYRAASEIRHHDDYESDDDDDEEEDEEDSSGRYSQEKGEIIYGKPKPGPHNIVPPYTPPSRHRIKRSPAEYHGGIYPHYDYSDPKPVKTENVEIEEATKQKKVYPKKHQPEISVKPHDPYKYPIKGKKVSKTKDNFGHATEDRPEEYKEAEEQNEEQEEAGEEEEQEQEQEDPADKIPPIKYTYDNSFHIPELKVKKYPYERYLRNPSDSKKAGSSSNARYSNYDEYTEDYEKYKTSLPSDLEKYFGSPDIEDRYTVAATQNLEKDKNCEKVAKAPPADADGKVKREAESENNQVCYICRDPKTGGSYEQCAYATDPKSEKFFYGGSSSYQTNEKKEPVTYKYRNRRSPYEDHFSDLEHFIFGEPSSKRIARKDIDYVPKPKKVNRKKYQKPTNPKRNPKYKYDKSYKTYDPLAKIVGAPSTYADESARVEGPPESYNGPAYTYEGPSRPYEGPKVTYEGPASPYEGPAEPYEGPINQEYYDYTDERLQDDEYHPPKQDYQGTSPKGSKYYSDYQKSKPAKAQAYSVKHSRPSRGPKSEVEEFQGGNFRAGDGYIADYRFGPEVFEEEETEPTRRNEEIKAPKKAKIAEKRGPHKFSNGDEKTSASTESEDTEEFIGHVRVYKNGDVCQKKKKDGMICMVCKNEKTSASYEQCQYSSKPKDKYFTFGSQKSYSSNKAPSDRHERNADSDQFPEKSDIIEKKILITKESKVFGDDTEAPESLVGAESRNYDRFREFLMSGDLVGAFSDNSETRVDDPDEQSDGKNNKKSTETVERIEPRDEVEGLEEFLYGTPDNDKKATEEGGYKSYDDYFHSLFPEFAKNAGYTEEGESEKEGFDPFENIRAFKEDAPEEHEEISPADISDSPKSAEASNEEPLRLKDQASRIPEEFYESYTEDHKKDLEKALGEFQNRDWSNCKKIVKKKLTCYQCIDKNGVSNEECMYVEASQPVSKHLAYHEKKELKPPVSPNREEAESVKNEQTAAAATDLTAEPNKTDDAVFRRIRKPKNSRPDVIEVTETPLESVNSEQYAPQKGDFEGVRSVSAEEVTFTTNVPTTYETEPEITTQKPRIKKHRKSQKKRIKYTKGDGNETTTEAARKRKYPIKKFSENDRTIQNEDSVNLNVEETTQRVNEDDGSVVKIFFNNTESSTS